MREPLVLSPESIAEAGRVIREHVYVWAHPTPGGQAEASCSCKQWTGSDAGPHHAEHVAEAVLTAVHLPLYQAAAQGAAGLKVALAYATGEVVPDTRDEEQTRDEELDGCRFALADLEVAVPGR